ncbi:hypothetical protein B0T11DRAFT_355895 [Plectosphaerella cucumerina]|uniref:Uncharacterized protein n=1 Tax=Plectosphaerella cucumerina TaxID=40658 RepID=A0A8K0X207_9PEZI|nr:hypothetical protein B0T11DRAFT_355895 [Plectosphaerella cucumerina]
MPSVEVSRSQTPGQTPARPPAADNVLPSVETPWHMRPTTLYTISPAVTPVSAGARAHSRLSIGSSIGGARLGSNTPPGMGGVAQAFAGIALRSQSPASPTPARPVGPPRCVVPAAVHRVEDEELPPHRFHAPEVQVALEEARAVPRRLAEVLSGGRLHLDPATAVHRLRHQAWKLQRFAVSSKRAVGFVGDSGTGKSSLINSLLDYDGLARTSNAGGACTCVATEYIYHDRDDFVIEVELFTREEVAEQLADHLFAYRARYANNDREGGEIEAEAGAREGMVSAAALAQATFGTMFGRRVDREFLCRRESRDVLADMTRWATEMYPAAMGERMAPLETARECSEALERVTSRCSEEGDEGATWPYIRQVKVFLRSHILRNGLVLVDLPGLHDANVARIAVTERQLKKCDDIFAIGRIGRAKTDDGIVSVFDLAARVGLANVGIVCTMSDDENEKEAVNDRKGQERIRLRGLHQTAENLEQQARQADREVRECAQGDMETIQAALARHWDLEAQHKAAAGAAREYMILTRNDEVTRSLQTTFGHRTAPGNVFRVFCVSSSYYREYRQRPQQPGDPDWLALSGIIDLRRHCLGLTADAQLRSLATYINSAVPRLIADVGQWARTGEDNVGAEARTELGEVKRRVREALRGEGSPLTRMYTIITTSFEQEVYAARRIEAWTKAAAAVSLKWRETAASSFAASCRKHGVHDSKNWNEEAVKAVADGVKHAWNGWIAGARRAVLDLVVSRLTAAATLDGTRLTTLLSGTARLGALDTSLSKRRDNAVQEMERAWIKFEKGLKDLHSMAFTGIASSLMAKSLRPAYNTCNQFHGRGSDQLRKDKMKGAVDDQGLFANLMINVCAKVGGLAFVLKDEMTTVGEELAEGVEETISLARGEETEGDRDPVLRMRVGEQTEAARREIVRLGELVR